jgi:NAD(P)-dependent dehydrogenase (short-subunit alcohol dehydrogenase family)
MSGSAPAQSRLLEGRSVIVSGIGAGFGRDLAIAMARHGANVTMGARRDLHLRSVADEITAEGGTVVWRTADICDPDDCAALVSLAVESFGGVHALVNNAFDPGVSAGSPYAWTDDGQPVTWHTMIDADMDVWRRAMDVNFFGTLAMTKAAVPALAETGDGRVIMINTQSSMWIKATHGAYAASKGALWTATKTLARELGPMGIRVNSLHPGFIDGIPVSKSIDESAERVGIPVEQLRGAIAAETCLGYLPSGEELAGAAVFFASDLAKPITGQALAINAGHWLH